MLAGRQELRPALTSDMPDSAVIGAQATTAYHMGKRKSRQGAIAEQISDFLRVSQFSNGRASVTLERTGVGKLHHILAGHDRHRPQLP